MLIHVLLSIHGFRQLLNLSHVDDLHISSSSHQHCSNIVCRGSSMVVVMSMLVFTFMTTYY